MLRIYTSYNCGSCKKATAWLEQKGIVYENFNLFSKKLQEKDVLSILKYTENGFVDIISTRSKIYEHVKDDVKDKTVNQYVKFIIDNPSILRRPIIVDDVTENILIGYNENEMNILL